MKRHLLIFTLFSVQIAFAQPTAKLLSLNTNNYCIYSDSMLNINGVAPAGNQGLYFYSETAEFHQTLYHLDTNNILRRISITNCGSLSANFRKVVASFNGNCFYAINRSMLSGQYAGISYYSPVKGSGTNLSLPSIFTTTIAQFVSDIARLPNAMTRSWS